MATIVNTRDVILRVYVPRYTSGTDYQGQINSINTTLANIASDALLTEAERQALRKEWDIITAEYVNNSTNGLAYLDNLYPAVATFYTGYVTKYQALATYLNGGTTYTPPALGSTPTNAPLWISNTNLTNPVAQSIISDNFRLRWKEFYDARTLLINKATEEAGKVANWSSVVAKPADTSIYNSYVGGNLYPSIDMITVPSGTYGVEFHSFRDQAADVSGVNFKPGEVVTISAEIFADQTVINLGNTGTLYLFCTDSTGTWKATATASQTVGNTWTRVSATVTLPSDINNMWRIALGLWRQPGGADYSGNVYARAIQVERGYLMTAYTPMNTINAIATQNIQMEATTAARYVEGLVSTTANNWYDICSLTIDSGGMPIYIQATFKITYTNGVNSGSTPYFHFYYDGIDTETITIGNIATDWAYTKVYWYPTPTTGSHTFAMRVYRSSTSNPTGCFGGLFALGIKR